MNKISLWKTGTGDEVEVYGTITTSGGNKIEIITYFSLDDGFVEYDGFGPYIQEVDPTISQEESLKLSDDFVAQILIEESRLINDR